MLRGNLIHPDILAALGTAGHGSRILIADGNFPFQTCRAPGARLVSLNLSPGVVSVTQVLDALLWAIPIEAAAVMDYPSQGPYRLDADPPIWSDFRKALADTQKTSLELNRIERFEFYRAAVGSDVALTIATGDQRIFANLLLTIGVVFPVESP